MNNNKKKNQNMKTNYNQQKNRFIKKVFFAEIKSKQAQILIGNLLVSSINFLIF